ncbi:hypothetical protein HYPSUDRAFT_143659, partial [Hypholoma sublateritium FD-334 SS-4]
TQALLWDLFSNIGYDYELLWRWPNEIPAATYVISRLSTLIFSIVSLSSTTTSDTTRCATLVAAMKWSIAVVIPTTSLLLFFRIRALYRQSRIVCSFFFFTWLAVLCTCLLHTQIGILIDIKATRQARRCFVTGNDSLFVNASTFLPMVNDFLIFCATTYKLTSTASVGNPTPKTRVMIAVFGTYLPAFSRTLLQDGQAYLLTLFPIYTFTIVCFALYPHQISHYAVVVAFPGIALANLMACKIYRKTRLGIHTTSETDFSKPSQPMVFNGRPSNFASQIDREQNSIVSPA